MLQPAIKKIQSLRYIQQMILIPAFQFHKTAFDNNAYINYGGFRPQ